MRSKTLCFKIPEELLEQARKAAKLERRNLSDFIRLAIEDKVSRKYVDLAYHLEQCTIGNISANQLFERLQAILNKSERTE